MKIMRFERFVWFEDSGVFVAANFDRLEGYFEGYRIALNRKTWNVVVVPAPYEFSIYCEDKTWKICNQDSNTQM